MSFNSQNCPFIFQNYRFIFQKCSFVSCSCPFVFQKCPFVSQKCLFISQKCLIVFQNCPWVFQNCLLFISCAPSFLFFPADLTFFSSCSELLRQNFRCSCFVSTWNSNLWCLLDNLKTSIWSIIFMYFIQILVSMIAWKMQFLSICNGWIFKNFPGALSPNPH